MKPHTANFVSVFSTPDNKSNVPQALRLSNKTTFIETTLQKSVTVSLSVNVKYNQTNPNNKSDWVRVQKTQSQTFPKSYQNFLLMDDAKQSQSPGTNQIRFYESPVGLDGQASLVWEWMKIRICHRKPRFRPFWYIFITYFIIFLGSQGPFRIPSIPPVPR